MRPDTLSLTKEQEASLISNGIKIEKWKKGELRIVGGYYPRSLRNISGHDAHTVTPGGNDGCDD